MCICGCLSTCRVLPIVLLFSLYRANTGDSSNLYSRNCIHPWKLDISIPMHNNCCIYLLQIRHVSANCKRPPLHFYYITPRHCVCFAICSGAPSQQVYSSSFCKKTFVYWVSYWSITVVDCCIRMHTTAHLVVKCHRIFYTKMPPLIVVYVYSQVHRCCNPLVCTIMYTILNRWQYLVKTSNTNK